MERNARRIGWRLALRQAVAEVPRAEHPSKQVQQRVEPPTPQAPAKCRPSTASFPPRQRSSELIRPPAPDRSAVPKSSLSTVSAEPAYRPQSAEWMYQKRIRPVSEGSLK